MEFLNIALNNNNNAEAIIPKDRIGCINQNFYLPWLDPLSSFTKNRHNYSYDIGWCSYHVDGHLSSPYFLLSIVSYIW